MPRLERIANVHRELGVTVISIGRGRPATIAAFVEKTGMRHPVAVDALPTFESWDVGAVPVAFLIDANRKIVAHGLDDAERYLRALAEGEPT